MLSTGQRYTPPIVTQYSKLCLICVKVVQHLIVKVSKLSQTFLKVMSKLSKQLSPCCLHVVPSGDKVLSMLVPVGDQVSMQFSNCAKWRPSCPNQLPIVVHVVPKWCQVVSIYMTMWPRDVLSIPDICFFSCP